MSNVLWHEIWVNTDGLEMCCLAGPDGDDARALSPKSRLVHVFAAESHYAAMVEYNRYLGRVPYTTEHAEDFETYPADWIQRQQAAVEAWRQLHLELLGESAGSPRSVPQVLVDWTGMEREHEHLEWNAVSTTAGNEAVMREVVLITVRRAGQETGPAKIFPKGTEPTEALAVEVANIFGEMLQS